MEVTAGCTQRTVSCSLLLFQLTQLPPVPDCVLAMELPPATNHVSRAPPAQGASNAPVLNFGGQGSELWCEGGEVGFISKMIAQSVRVRDLSLFQRTV